MSFIRAWLDDVFRDYVRTNVGMIEVLELQQDSKEWQPEWQCVRRERAVRGVVEASCGAGSEAAAKQQEWQPRPQGASLCRGEVGREASEARRLCSKTPQSVANNTVPSWPERRG